jgi:hypothetical protein
MTNTKQSKDVADAINANFNGSINWICQSSKLSRKVKGHVAMTSLTNEHAYSLAKYPHSTQDKLADVIIRKKISSHKDILRPFLKSFDANPSADLDELADKAWGIETVTVPKTKLPKEVLEKIDEEKKQLAKVTKIKRKKPSKPITKAQVKKKMVETLVINVFTVKSLTFPHYFFIHHLLSHENISMVYSMEFSPVFSSFTLRMS